MSNSKHRTATDTSAPADTRTPRAPQPSLLPTQGSPYRPPPEDEEEEDEDLWIENGEHPDETNDYSDDDHALLAASGQEDATDTEQPDDADAEHHGADRRETPDETEALSNTLIDMRNFMINLRRIGGVFVSHQIRRIVATGDQAIVLSQVLYWLDHGRNDEPRARIRRRNKLWFYKSHADFAYETGLKPRQVRACLAALQRRKYIELAYFRAEGQRTTHIHLNLGNVYEAITGVKRP
jgi:hypothetical protein